MIHTHEATELSQDERLRYRRHLRLPDVGLEGQRKLKQARVALIGAGGLGAPSALYLAAAGVGTIGIIDDDVVDASNLQRQVIHSTSTIGQKKTASAAQRIHELNPHVKVEQRVERLTPETAVDFVRGYDIVVDGADNFPTRYAASDACVIAEKPYVYGAVYRFEGHVSWFDARTGPCYRCLFPEAPPAGLAPSCEDAGVLGVVPGIIGLLQATEAIKAIIGIGTPLSGRLLVYDALDASFRELRVRKDPACPACGDSSTMSAPLGAADACAGDGQRSASVQQTPFDVQPQAVKDRLDRKDAFEFLDVRDDDEIEIAALPHTMHIPAHEVAERVAEIPRDRDVVVFCHSGGRSSRVTTLLRMQGFENVFNMNGGATRWSAEVDPTVPKY
ncbi:MAG TPA: molybdopterin-synthase adenylyltransferase MoeB [Candidatus Eremiobacteraceae bacterium]|nr:molybdopterin-synthase adenylyltransferase MoeB [Candidatus Eremiobacteraceae bacterium]